MSKRTGVMTRLRDSIRRACDLPANRRPRDPQAQVCAAIRLFGTLGGRAIRTDRSFAGVTSMGSDGDGCRSDGVHFGEIHLCRTAVCLRWNDELRVTRWVSVRVGKTGRDWGARDEPVLERQPATDWRDSCARLLAGPGFCSSFQRGVKSSSCAKPLASPLHLHGHPYRWKSRDTATRIVRRSAFQRHLHRECPPLIFPPLIFPARKCAACRQRSVVRAAADGHRRHHSRTMRGCCRGGNCSPRRPCRS